MTANADEVIAREEIAAYYSGRLEEARQELERAQAAFDAAVSERDAWEADGEITAHPGAGYDLAVHAIVARANSTYLSAANAAIYRDGSREAAATARARDEALRRWLTAQGHDLGALAIPAPTQRGRRSRR